MRTLPKPGMFALLKKPWHEWAEQLVNAIERQEPQSGVQLKVYPKASLPSAEADGFVIIVSDEIGGRTIATSDGTNWRRVSDGAVVS